MNKFNNLKKKSIGLFLLTVLTVFSCSNDNEPRLTNPLTTKPKVYTISEMENASGLPFSTESYLRSASEESKGVDYELSRKAALIEMKYFNDLFLKIDKRGEFKLSQKAIIIRDAKGNAKFYEYIVFNKDGKAIATITNYAKKEINDFSAYVLPYVRNYDDTKALKYSETYPYNPTYGELRSASMKQDEIESNPETDEFWSKATDWASTVENKTDQEVINQNQLRGWFDTSTAYHTIPEFDRQDLQLTRFGGACGPSALAWVYRAYYDSFQGQYIPLHGEKDTDYYVKGIDYENNSSYYSDKVYCPILKEFNKHKGWLFIENAMTAGKFDDIVAEFFPNHIITKDFFNSGKGAPRRAIKSNRPVYMIVGSGVQLHYLIGFGTKDKYGWFGFHSNSWILVMDNGATIKKHGYRPYYRNSHFFNILNKFVSYGEFTKI